MLKTLLGINNNNPVTRATAYLNKIPFVILRAISDKADDSATVDYPTFEKKAIEHSVNLVKGMLEKLMKIIFIFQIH